WLLPAVIRRLLLVGPDQAQLIVDPRLFQCPAHAQVANQTLGKRRRPAQRGQPNYVHPVLLRLLTCITGRVVPAEFDARHRPALITRHKGLILHAHRRSSGAMLWRSRACRASESWSTPSL